MSKINLDQSGIVYDPVKDPKWAPPVYGEDIIQQYDGQLDKIVEQLRFCDFGNDSHNIKNNIAFIALCRMAERQDIVLKGHVDPNRFNSKTKFNHHLVEEGVKLIIKGIGDDPHRLGVLETPKRVADMYQEILNGYDEIEDIKKYVKLFDENHSGMVIVKDVPFYSFCEHHMIPFAGKIAIAYIPIDKTSSDQPGGVLGLSKLVRIARLFAKQLQVQERLTAEIADAISKYVPNQGVAVRIEAEHMCMSIRGVRTPGAKTVTTKLTGLFFDDPKTRSEFQEAL